MSFSLIILAGGNSHRFGSNISKPYQKLAGKSLIEINVIKAHKFKQIKKIIVVYNKKDIKRVKSLNLKNVKLITGGDSRQQSTFNALKHLKNTKGIFEDKISYAKTIKDALSKSQCVVIMTQWKQYEKLNNDVFTNMTKKIVTDCRRMLAGKQLDVDYFAIGIGK